MADDQLRDDLDGGTDHFECPDCGAECPVVYERYEFDPPMATGWCPESNVAKAVPVSEVKTVAE